MISQTCIGATTARKSTLILPPLGQRRAKLKRECT
jgi:hypothetical protein